MTPLDTALAFCYGPGKPTIPEQHNFLAALSTADAIAVIQECLGSLRDPNRSEIPHLDAILEYTAMLCPDALIRCYPDFLRHRWFHPDNLYYLADEAIARQLVHILETDDLETDLFNYWHIPEALGQIGGTYVEQIFQQWRTMPPQWAKDLPSFPEAYANVGGWQLLADGTRRDLIDRHGVLLTTEPPQPQFVDPHDPVVADPADLIEVFTPAAALCGWCGEPLVVAFDLPFDHPKLRHIGPKGHVRILTCPGTMYFETIYTDVDAAGSAAWSPANKEKSLFDCERYDDEPFVLRLAQSHHSPLTEGQSHIGGFPTWVQDVEYPVCPGCNLQMPCVAQLEGDGWDGFLSAYLCQPCGKAATAWQQG